MDFTHLINGMMRGEGMQGLKTEGTVHNPGFFTALLGINAGKQAPCNDFWANEYY